MMRGLLLVTALLVACAKPAEPPAESRPGMAFIPGGEYLQGSRADDARIYEWEKAKEQPQHPVRVGAFYIDLHEVTNREFEQFTPGHKRNAERSPCDDCPVVEVSWTEARDYCAAQQKRLPTEAEWEKAAKGGAETDPNPLDDFAWYSKNSIARTQPVAKKQPNGYGLYDMLGNVREWTADWYDPGYYGQRIADEPKGPATGQRRVERGGAFFLPARGVTSTIRYNHPPHFRLYFLGFRCAQDAAKP